MKLNFNFIILIIIFVLAGLSLFFILTRKDRSERYSMFQEIKEDRDELIDDVILKILGTRLSEFKLKQIADQTQGRNNLNYKYYLKDVIETLKSPNYLRFINQFLPDAKRTLKKMTWTGEPIFNVENLTELLRVIRVEEELQRQREQVEQEWEEAQAGGIVPQPFLPPDDQPIVPQPFLPPGDQPILPPGFQQDAQGNFVIQPPPGFIPEVQGGGWGQIFPFPQQQEEEIFNPLPDNAFD